MLNLIKPIEKFEMGVMARKISDSQFPFSYLQLTLSSGSIGFPGLSAIRGSPIAECLISATNPQRGSQATDSREVDTNMFLPGKKDMFVY